MNYPKETELVEELDLRLDLSLERLKDNLNSTVDLIKQSYLPSGTRFGLGELSETPSIDALSSQVDKADGWVVASQNERKAFLRNVIIYLGLAPEQLTGERAEKTYTDEGIRGEPSEGGADVMVFKTHYPRLELHVLDYRNRDVGRRYNLVVAD